MRSIPDNLDDYVDIRDVIKRIEELEEQVGHDAARRSYGLSAGGWYGLLEGDRQALIEKHAVYEELCSELEELGDLKLLMGRLKGCGGDYQYASAWYPVTLIRDSYFQDHAREMAEEIGAINKEAAWPAQHIDWEAAADALKMDYTSVDWGDIKYWYR